MGGGGQSLCTTVDVLPSSLSSESDDDDECGYGKLYPEEGAVVVVEEVCAVGVAAAISSST